MEIKIQNKDDGVWFVFEVDGKSCAVNMSKKLGDACITKKIFIQWFDKLWKEGFSCIDHNRKEAVFELLKIGDSFGTDDCGTYK